MPIRLGMSAMLMRLSMSMTRAAGSGIDMAIFLNLTLPQQTGPALLPVLRAELAKGEIDLGIQLLPDGRAQGTRLRMGVHGCDVPSRCPKDPTTAAHALARHLNAPPLVWEWIEVFDTSLKESNAPLPMLGFGAADDGVAEVYFRRSWHSEEYPNLPIARGLTLPALLRAVNLSTGLALAEVALEWSVKQPERGVRLRVHHSERSVLLALDRWGTHRKIARGQLGVWAAPLANATAAHELIWTSPPYEPLTIMEPPRLFPTKLAIKASVPSAADARGENTSPQQVGAPCGTEA